MEERYLPRPYVEIKHPEWSKNATIYEVNIRQFTPEGTFQAFASHLPRIKALGIDIIWLMPIHPIGEVNRKGTLGSYYSIKDFYGINPEFGTLADFKALVEQIHDMGMYVIIDWVANHSAWDNPLVEQHPEWFLRTPQGTFQPTPWYDWDDIINFDYEQPGIRRYMTEALKYWVQETDIDGYRCDVAGFVPIDFWENARAELDAVKPVFMLAEWESRDLHRKAFDMTYSWSLYNTLREVIIDRLPMYRVVRYMAHDFSSFPRGGYRMTFTDNHDKNSWEGTQFSNFGEGLYVAIIMSALVNGMPLVYGGQEAGLDYSLPFFEKDHIKWKAHPIGDLFQRLFELKHRNQALWNGEWGGQMARVNNDQPEAVVSFAREKNGDKVLPVVNLRDQAVTVKVDAAFHPGQYTELFTNKIYTFPGDETFRLPPWGYLVLVRSA